MRIALPNPLASAPPWLAARLEEEARSAGLRIAYNQPYAGGYVIERHSNPAKRHYALQIEIDRTAYLNEQGDPHPEKCQQMAARLKQDANAVQPLGFITPGQLTPRGAKGSD